jgi:hypothetical protein
MISSRTQETLGYEPTGWDYDHENDTSAPEQLAVELFKHHGYEHKDISQFISIPISDEEIEAAAKLDYVNWRLEEAKQRPKNKDGLGEEATAPVGHETQHRLMYPFQALSMPNIVPRRCFDPGMDDGQPYVAKNKPFTLSNGLQLTYGQINGLPLLEISMLPLIRSVMVKICKTNATDSCELGTGSRKTRLAILPRLSKFYSYAMPCSQSSSLQVKL